MFKFIAKLRKDEKGATAIEYGLIAALVSIAAIGALGTLGTEVTTAFQTVGDEIGENNTAASSDDG
ncbi:MAG: Flp family type IVb pilin [Pseudomonadota bacterium]